MQNDHLFELIKSLSKTEKRYFKLTSSLHTIGDENNYIVLFDYLDKIDDYNESSVLLHFKKQAFINNFSITKKRLYDRILSSLDTYQSQYSVDAQLFKLLNSADILFQKALYDQTKKILVSAQKIALKNQRYLILMEIHKRNERLFENSRYQNITNQQIKELKKSKFETIHHITEHVELWSLKSELFIELSLNDDYRSQTQHLGFDNIYQTLLKCFNTTTLSVENLYLYHHISSAYFFAIHDFESCKKSLASNIDIFDNHPVFRNQNLHSYFSVITNAIYIHQELQNSKEAKFLLEKLKSLKRSTTNQLSEDLEIKLFSSISSISINLISCFGTEKEALILIHDIELGLIKYSNKLSTSRQVFLNYKCATTLVYLGNYTEALKWVNKILNNPVFYKEESIIANAHFLELIIHLELKNNSILPHLVRRTERLLKSRKLLFPFENMLIRVINKLIKSENTFDQELILESFYHQILSLNKLETVYNIPEYFDFESWAITKVENKSFFQVFKQRRIGMAS